MKSKTKIFTVTLGLSLSLLLSFFNYNLDSTVADMDLSSLVAVTVAQAEDNDSEVFPDDWEDGRYVGESWGDGYSWSQQPVQSGQTVTVTGTLSFSSTGAVTASGGGSVSNTYEYISCCNPSNNQSSCNFGSNNMNCIRY